jgi:NAD(P)-dependent dehydrogenase (short-subunit alcohol dehydrogenase family)
MTPVPGGALVIVTGGGSGMGREVSLLLARDGGAVAVCDLDEGAAATVAAQISREGGLGSAHQLDVTDGRAVATLASDLATRHERIAGLVNCAGLSELAAFETVDEAFWQRIMAVNLTGVFHTCREFGDVMRRSRTGSIVNIASTAGLFGVPQMVAYTAAKHGVVGLTRALAVEWAKYGVRVNCICPGATMTPMFLGVTTAGYREQRARRIPQGRFAEPGDQARAIRFLLSEEAGHITGAVLTVDGGVSAMAPATGEGALWAEGGG